MASFLIALGLVLLIFGKLVLPQQNNVQRKSGYHRPHLHRPRRWK